MLCAREPGVDKGCGAPPPSEISGIQHDRHVGRVFKMHRRDVKFCQRQAATAVASTDPPQADGTAGPQRTVSWVCYLQNLPIRLLVDVEGERANKAAGWSSGSGVRIRFEALRRGGNWRGTGGGNSNDEIGQ